MRLLKSEANLELSRKSTMELFCENSYRLKTVYSFCKKSFIVDVGLGSKYASGNTRSFVFFINFNPEHGRKYVEALLISQGLMYDHILVSVDLPR